MNCWLFQVPPRPISKPATAPTFFQITPVLVNNIKPKLFFVFECIQKKKKKSNIQFIQKYPNETNICKNAKNASEYAHKPNIFASSAIGNVFSKGPKWWIFKIAYSESVQQIPPLG